MSLADHNASASTETLARLDEKIQQQTALLSKQIKSLSDLCAERNSHLPVFRLPPETLAIIFTHGARDYYESNSGGQFTSRIPTWVNVSYVCRHWRNISLDCSTLWTYPFHLSLRWTEELLLRSNQAPLKISCISSVLKDNEWPGFLERFLKHSERIQELRLHLLPRFLPAEISLSARLEKLEIEVQIWDDSMQCMAITDADKPLLRTLKLANCSSPWYSLNLGGLKTLSLCHVPSRLNIIEFLTILGGMPDLVVLHLEDVLPSARDFLSNGGAGISSKIDLPHLTRLAIVDPLSVVVALLSCVNIPLKTQLSLELRFEPGSSVDDYHPIVSFIAQRFSMSEGRSSSDPIRSLIINARALTFSTLERDYEPRFPRTFENWHYDIPLEVILGTSKTEEMEDLTMSDKHRIMGDICCSFPLPNVQSLHVIYPTFSSAIWKEILGHLDGLRYMKLTSGPMPDLSFLSLTAHEPEVNLNGQQTRDQGPTRDHVFVPALEELELDSIKFMDHTPWEDGVSEKSLFDALSTREGLSDRVIMIDCET